MTQKVIKIVGKDNFSEECLICQNKVYPHSFIRVGMINLCFLCHSIILDKAIKEIYYKRLYEK